jgi:hypothetical protein
MNQIRTLAQVRCSSVHGIVVDKEPIGKSLRLASFFGFFTFLVHVAVNLRAQRAGYGLFRDELYYIACGRNPAWGYVDQPPIIALVARFSELMFGWHSLVLFRILPSLAGAFEVAGTGLIAQEMGGRRTAQAVAMIGVMTSPVILAVDAFLSMNSFEPLFWMGTTFALMRALQGEDARWWALAGVLAGLGLENKWNEAFFLFAVLGALLLSPVRRKLKRGLFICIVLVVLVALPNLIWEAHRGWPTLVWLHNTRSQGKNIVYGPGLFIWNQIFIVGPISSILWIGGLIWLLFSRRARPWQWIGVTYLLYLTGMMILHANDYYLAPVYPLLFAAGGMAWNQWLTSRALKRAVVATYTFVIAAYSMLGILIVEPVLTPSEYIHYIKPSGLRPREFNASAKSPLPELMADMTGWQEMANKLAEVYWSLPKKDREKAGVLTLNYGEASAVNVYRPDLPPAISGHQNYWYWGPRGHDGSVMVVIGFSKEELKRHFSSVTEVARTTNPWGQPHEATPIYICRDSRSGLIESWPLLKRWL